jgi:hypothetical protein
MRHALTDKPLRPVISCAAIIELMMASSVAYAISAIQRIELYFGELFTQFP